MNNIKEYDFVDCLVVDFNTDNLLSTIGVIIEAYYPNIPGIQREKGLLKMICHRIRSLNFIKNDEFDDDIQLHYDKSGDDMKANEIYSIECVRKDEQCVEVVFKSDFLNFDLSCNSVEFIELRGL